MLNFPLPVLAELYNDVVLGAGLRWRPAYGGSDVQGTELVPVIRYLRQPWFVRSTQGVLEGGARMVLTPGFHAGAQLAYEPGRATGESDFPRNRNVPSVNAGASLGAQVEWDHKFGPVPVTLITPQQSAASGLPVYAARSGLLFASYGLPWSVGLNPRWLAPGNIESRHLRGDAARSPLAERGGNYRATAGVAHRFRGTG
ncbi:MAG: MipA/OmpV family protein [Burkholderiales bacterium]